MNIKITIQYDGTNFSGWQIQPNVRTVQGELSEAIKKIYYKETITIYGSGRTDTGVHALAQVASFKIPFLKMPIEKFHYALNNHLPYDIRVIKAEIVNESFNARASAKWREYLYIIMNSDIYSPFLKKYSWFYRKNVIDIEKINSYANVILGEHDFTSFCSSSDENDSKYRYIERSYAIRKKEIIYFIIKGNAFLHNMVRIIVGTFVEAQKKDLKASDIKEILESKDRRNALVTAPPQGLYLRRIIY